MLKKKNNFLILFLIIILFAITGCLTNQQKTSGNQQVQSENQQQNQPQETVNNQRTDWNDNFSEASQEDLEVGQRVLVMGSENSDGSISANQIMIGSNETNFEEMGREMRPNIDNNGSNDQTFQPPADVQGQRPNMEQFQNMSEEERQKFREEMMAQREASGMTRPSNIGGNMVRLNGEIINKDDQTITLKLEEGGSKLIFVSEATNVLKLKD